MAFIHVEEEGLSRLKEALLDKGDTYKGLLARLEALVDTTLKSDIQGDLADDFKCKFEAKREHFNQIVKTIEQSEEYLGIKGSDFNDMITTLKEKTS